MAKLLWVKSRFKSRFSNEGPFKRLWDWFVSLDKFVRLAIVVLVLIGIATPIIISQRLNTSQHAASTKTATIDIVPATGTFTIGQPFTVNLVIDGGGQAFNAAQATIQTSTNLTIQNLTLTAASSGGCGFTFINTQKTPSVSNPSFIGAILNGSSSSCNLYSMSLLPNAAGPATITISGGLVKSYANSGEILLSTQNASYTIAPSLSPTPTTSPATPTPTPSPVPSSTPIPTPSPTPSPTTQPVQPPTTDAHPTDTYQGSLNLTGTMNLGLTVFVNNSSTAVTYPTTTTWQYAAQLVLGINTFTLFAKDSLGNQSSPVTTSINLHKLGDINGDGVIDLTDLSMFATDWGNTGILNYALSDMNADGVIDLTDFSVIAKAYGN